MKLYLLTTLLITLTLSSCSNDSNSFMPDGKTNKAFLISGQPSEFDNQTGTTTISLTGATRPAYKYKIGLKSATDCSNLTDYGSKQTVITPIIIDRSTYSDGEYLLCILGFDGTDWDDVSKAVTYSWVQDTTPPTPPTAFAPATSDLNTVTFTWSGAADNIGPIVGYEVAAYQADNTLVQASRTVSGFTLSGPLNLVAGDQYYFKIIAIDKAGNKSTPFQSALWTAVDSTSGGGGGGGAPPADTTAPTVASVTSTLADGNYKVGQVIPVKVTFSEAVVLTGTPRLRVQGSTTAYATYVSKTGAALLFNYTVVTGDIAADFDVYDAGSLDLQTGTLADAAGNTAVLTLPTTDLSATRAIVIDTTSPAITGVSTTLANGTYKAGQVIPVTVTFGEAVTLTGTPRLKVNTGTTSYAAYVSKTSTALLFNYTVVTGDKTADFDVFDAGSLDLQTGTLKDAASNDAVLTLGTTDISTAKAIVVDAVAPTAPTGFSDGSSSDLSSSPSMTWTAGTDADSGVHHYMLAIGTTSGGTGTLTWTNIGNVVTYQKTGLTLVNGTTYYASLKTVDAAGNESSVVNGDGWTAASGPVDCSTAAPSAGATCTNGTLVGGILSAGKTKYRLFVTPKGCTDSATPTCDGTTADVTKVYGTRNVPSPVVLNTILPDNGPKNSSVIATVDTAATDSAARYCENMTYAGFTDWYLPAKDEFLPLGPQVATLGMDSVWYWSSTEDDGLGAFRAFAVTSPSSSTTQKSNATAVRCMRRLQVQLSAWPQTLYQLGAILPTTDSAWSTLTITNSGSSPLGSLVTAKTGTGIEIDSATDLCSGQTLAPAGTCTLKVRVSSLANTLLKGKITVTSSDGVAVDIPVSGYIAKNCSVGTPTVGDICEGGNIYTGATNYGSGAVANMMTPGGCNDSTNPTCLNTNDALTKAYGSAVTHNSASSIDGKANTAAIITAEATAPAAKFCKDMVFGGFNDWYLPALDELMLALTNKPSIGGMTNSTYMSSTQVNASNFYYAYYTSTAQTSTKVGSLFSTRCMRRPAAAGYLDASATNIFGLDSTLPTQTSSWATVKFTNNSAVDTLALTTAATTNFEINSGTNTCTGTALTAGSTCSVQVRSTSPTAGAYTGILTVADSNGFGSKVGLSGEIVVDCENPATTTAGSYCKGGVRLAGTYLTSFRIMTTPGNCTNSATPICDGKTDTLVLKYINPSNFTSGAISTSNGILNTTYLVSQTGAAAAKFCSDMVYGGYSDWYLPSSSELNLLYTNRVAIGAFNTTASGKYMSSTTTTVTGTQYTGAQLFSSGATSNESKTLDLLVRCVRKY